ncbi:MAG: DUF4384 domain-containing protein [Thermodesulfobacteriota bacterium]
MKILHFLHRTVLGLFLAVSFIIVMQQHVNAQQKPNIYVLLVGVGTYPDPSANLNLASGVTELEDFFKERRRLFNKFHFIKLTDDAATKARILKAFTEDLAQAQKDDVVFIYLEGHGSPLPGAPGEFYFSAYDTTDVAKTGIKINDKGLFKNIKSEKLIFFTGSCFSGGFLDGLARSMKQGVPQDFFGDFKGRFGISAAKDNEPAWVPGKFGMSLFCFYVIKGLRGAADAGSGKITVDNLFNYVKTNVSEYTAGKQNPHMFKKTSKPEDTTIIETPRYDKPLEVNIKFFYETSDNQLKLLTSDSVLKSGAHIGAAFKPKSDCYMHIFWVDSNGKFARVFPNPQLTEGTESGEVKGGKTIWLPYKGSRQWYVLDKHAGTETVYVVASRERNTKLEELYQKLQGLTKEARKGGQGSDIENQIEGELNLMGIESFVVPVQQSNNTFVDSKQLFDSFDNSIQVAKTDLTFKLQFKHVAE